MKSSSQPPAPDPNIGLAAMKQAETGEDWLDFAKDAFAVSEQRMAELDDLTRQITDQQIEFGDEQLAISRRTNERYETIFQQREDEFLDAADKFGERATQRETEVDEATRDAAEAQREYAEGQRDFAAEQRQRYDDKFRPIEDRFLDDVSTYDSDDRLAAAAAEAKADVMSSSAEVHAQQRRQAAAVGISPDSGRFAGIDRSTGLATALSSAGAQNNARQSRRNQALQLRGAATDMGRATLAESNNAAGRGAAGSASAAQLSAARPTVGAMDMALKGDIVNLGRGIPAQSAQAAGIGLGARSGAVGLHQGNQAAYLSSTGIMDKGFAGQMTGYQGQADTLNQQYRTEMSGWQTQQQAAAQSAAGIGQAIGGIFGAFLSDEDKKKNKKKVKDGEALDAVNAMPVSEYDYKTGEGDEGHHVGPMAQDFAEATGRGDGKTINVQDAIGITMKAVQDLDDKVDRLVAGIAGTRQPAAIGVAA